MNPHHQNYVVVVVEVDGEVKVEIGVVAAGTAVVVAVKRESKRKK